MSLHGHPAVSKMLGAKGTVLSVKVKKETQVNIGTQMNTSAQGISIGTPTKDVPEVSGKTNPKHA